MAFETTSDQMAGFYDFQLYKALVADVGNLAKDVALVKADQVRMRDPEIAPDGTCDLACFLDASESCAGDIAKIANTPIDTRDPGLWLALRDAVICCNRLVLFPDFDGEQGVSVYDLVFSTCLVFDMCARLADGTRDRDAMVSDMREAQTRVAPLYVDIVCGRGSAWLAYIDDLGCEAAALAGRNWVKMRDAYASQRSTELVGRLSGCSDVHGDAKKAYVESVLGIAKRFDDRQWKIMRDDTGEYSVLIDGDAFAQAVHIEVFNDVAESLIMPHDPVGDLRGYCKTFSMSPIACTFNVPVAFERVARKTMRMRRTRALYDRTVGA